MSPFTCISTLFVIGLVLIPSLNAETAFENERDGGLLNQARELLAKLKEEETTRDVDIDVLKTKIMTINNQYSELIANNDARGIVAMYDPEAVRISNGVSKTGLDGLQAEIETWINYVNRVEIASRKIVPLDRDAKFVFERKEFAMYGPSSMEALNRGMTVVAWKLTGDGYKVFLEMNLTT